MHFYSVLVFGTLAAIGLSAPAPAADNELDARQASYIPGLPGNLAGGMPSLPGMPSFSSSQQNECSGGEPYCCNSDQSSGGNSCAKASGVCDTTVICCNNNFGVSETWSELLLFLFLAD
jgi:hypothetical protein